MSGDVFSGLVGQDNAVALLRAGGRAVPVPSHGPGEVAPVWLRVPCAAFCVGGLRFPLEKQAVYEPFVVRDMGQGEFADGFQVHVGLLFNRVSVAISAGDCSSSLVAGAVISTCSHRAPPGTRSHGQK